MLVALGAGLWLSALNVQFRDVAYLVPFLTQFWFFCTPVVYPTSLVPERWRWLIGLNPLTGVVESFRAALLGLEPAPGPQMAISAAVGLALVLTGLVWFRRMERSFADAV
jgi:lipopolysaccharide transport system permease protein